MQDPSSNMDPFTLNAKLSLSMIQNRRAHQFYRQSILGNILQGQCSQFTPPSQIRANAPLFSPIKPDELNYDEPTSFKPNDGIKTRLSSPLQDHTNNDMQQGFQYPDHFNRLNFAISSLTTPNPYSSIQDHGMNNEADSREPADNNIDATKNTNWGLLSALQSFRNHLNGYGNNCHNHNIINDYPLDYSVKNGSGNQYVEQKEDANDRPQKVMLQDKHDTIEQIIDESQVSKQKDEQKISLSKLKQHVLLTAMTEVLQDIWSDILDTENNLTTTNVVNTNVHENFEINSNHEPGLHDVYEPNHPRATNTPSEGYITIDQNNETTLSSDDQTEVVPKRSSISKTRNKRDISIFNQSSSDFLLVSPLNRSPSSSIRNNQKKSRQAMRIL